MISRMVLAGALAFGSIGNAAAQDRLKPVTPPSVPVIAQYDVNLHRAFREAFDADVKARVLFLPSFEPEEAIGLRKRGGAYELFALRAAQFVWGYSNADAAARIGLPARPEDIPLKRCTIALEAAPAEAILQAWRTMLAEVRPDDEPALGIDGETYVFAMRDPDGERRGEGWSPRPESRVGTLVRLAEAMRTYCRTRRRGDLAAIGTLAGALTPR